MRPAGPDARLRFSDEDPDSDEAGLQESEIRGLDGSHQRLQGGILGGPGLQFVQWKLRRRGHHLLEKWPRRAIPQKERKGQNARPTTSPGPTGKPPSSARCRRPKVLTP